MTDERDSKLVLKAEAALRSAPLREPDWDAFATRVDAALAAGGATDDALLLPPLPESIEDGSEPSGGPHEPLAPSTIATEAAASSTRETTSLADLARATLARRGAKEAVDLAKESLAIASQGRGNMEPVAPAPAAATIVVDREDSTFPSARRQRAADRERAAMDTRGPWIGVAIAAVGLAAGFGLYLTSKRTRVVEVPVAQNAAPAAVTAAQATSTALAEPKPEPAPVATEAPAVTPDALPPVAEKKAEPTEAPGALASAERISPKPSSPALAAHAPATPNGAHAEKVVLDEDRAANGAGAAAKPAPSDALRPAELTSNGSGISDRPSTGAAQAAVGAVLGAARACLAGQPQPSNATLVFGSNGEVTSVNVSGPAAGTPAAACVKGALGKARVQPFAAQSFSLGVTVRPL
ncbi:MAG TPA: hypothetical protein VMI54_23565 [Polyangiaceae bacterium]|nr:hypothetical protein [Polyangiaceae bacterium]